MNEAMSQDQAQRLVRRVFGGLTLLFILFIVYASWTPADDVQNPEGLFANFHGIRDLFRGHNLRDIATNVLLYTPLGIFLALGLSAGKLRFLSPALFFGTLISLAMETGQSFIGRTPDLVDIITNSIGHAIGYSIVVMAVRIYGLNPLVFMGFDPSQDQDKKTQSIAAFRFIAICVYILIALLPFDVSVRLSEVYAQLLPDDTGVPRLILDPTYAFSHWSDHGLKLTVELWALLPVAALTAFLGGIRGRLHVLSPIFTCVFLASFCETAQLFILSRRTDIAMLPIAVLSGLLAWFLVRAWFKLQHVEMDKSNQEQVSWQSIVLALLAYALIIALFAWAPFTFETDMAAVFEKIRHQSNLLPFKQHFQNRNLGSAVDIVKEAGLFIPLGMLTARLLLRLRPTLSRLPGLAIAAIFCGVYATFTELSQAVVIGRYIDITDVFLGGAGGLCGAAFMQLFMIRSQKEIVSSPSVTP